jgi:hypothetical protein
MSNADDCRERLERAGWSAVDACVVGPGGASWQVTISRGGEDLIGEGASPDEAWRDAWGLAEFVRWIESLAPALRPR